jgi:hypothetical protein
VRDGWAGRLCPADAPGPQRFRSKTWVATARRNTQDASRRLNDPKKLPAPLAATRTQSKRDTLADTVRLRAFEMVPMIPSGQFQIRTARNKHLVGQIEANGALFWNVRRV